MPSCVLLDLVVYLTCTCAMYLQYLLYNRVCNPVMYTKNTSFRSMNNIFDRFFRKRLNQLKPRDIFIFIILRRFSMSHFLTMIPGSQSFVFYEEKTLTIHSSRSFSRKKSIFTRFLEIVFIKLLSNLSPTSTSLDITSKSKLLQSLKLRLNQL